MPLLAALLACTGAPSTPAAPADPPADPAAVEQEVEVLDAAPGGDTAEDPDTEDGDGCKALYDPDVLQA
jgi:hypothetical protein